MMGKKRRVGNSIFYKFDIRLNILIIKKKKMQFRKERKRERVSEYIC